MKNKMKFLLLITTLLLAVGSSVFAASMTYNLSYSGVNFQNNAVEGKAHHFGY